MKEICTNCSKTLDDEASFCASCGTPKSRTVPCPRCARSILPDARFCMYCAFDLSMSILPAMASPLISLREEPSLVGSSASFELELAGDVATSTSPEIQGDPRSLISPSGAAFVLICLFLPWLEISGCHNQKRIVTGIDLLHGSLSHDSPSLLLLFWLFPLMSLIVIAVYVVCKAKGKLFKARPLIVVPSAIALCVAGWLSVGFRPLKSGFIGSVMGFVLAIIGCFFMKRPKKNEVASVNDKILGV
jgi:hypothetical protein